MATIPAHTMICTVCVYGVPVRHVRTKHLLSHGLEHLLRPVAHRIRTTLALESTGCHMMGK